MSVLFSSVNNLFFKGQMEYAIISFSVGEKVFSWLFHAVKTKEIPLLSPFEKKGDEHSPFISISRYWGSHQ